MEVIIRPSIEQAAELASRLIAARLRAKPDLVLGLATGRTMERVYDRLVTMRQSEGLDFSRCRTFNLEEYINLLKFAALHAQFLAPDVITREIDVFPAERR